MVTQKPSDLCDLSIWTLNWLQSAWVCALTFVPSSSYNECSGGLKVPRSLSDQQVNWIKGCSNSFSLEKSGELADWPFVFIFTFLGSDHVHLCFTDYFRYFESYLFNDNGSKFHFFKIHLCTSAQAPQLWWRWDDLSGRGLLCEASRAQRAVHESMLQTSVKWRVEQNSSTTIWKTDEENPNFQLLLLKKALVVWTKKTLFFKWLYANKRNVKSLFAGKPGLTWSFTVAAAFVC